MTNATLAQPADVDYCQGRRPGEQGYLTAVYRSRCPRCRNMIERGQPITLYKVAAKRKRWMHADCSDPNNGKVEPQNEPTPEPVVEPTPEPVVEPTPEPTQAVDNEQLAELLAKVAELAGEVDQLKEDRSPQVVEICKPNGETHRVDGAVHEAFEPVVKLAAAGKNVFVPGPAGCGKSHMAKQVADALDRSFGFISCSAGMSESQLLGRQVPTGDQGQFEYQRTEFVRCYEEGGVFLFDELDAADSNVLLVINAALANGHMAVPNRQDKPVAERHPDFVCVAAANTYGKGADREYVGRNELDEATLDRFRIGTVPMGYNEELEKQLCPHDELRAHLQTYRQRVVDNRLRRTVSTRFMVDAYEMVSQHDWTLEDVDRQLFSGWRDDEIRKVRGS